MLHFETDKDGDVVYVHLDAEGIEKLRNVLDFLSSDLAKSEHDHLSSPDWGGRELTVKIDSKFKDRDSSDNRDVHHVKLYFWPTGTEFQGS